MSAEKMREEFESWFSGRYPLTNRESTQSEILCKMVAEHAWQASRAAIEVELPKVAEYFDQSEYPHTCEMLERDLRSRIESLGLKVKP